MRYEKTFKIHTTISTRIRLHLIISFISNYLVLTHNSLPNFHFNLSSNSKLNAIIVNKSLHHFFSPSENLINFRANGL